jgi:uncharacterized protein (DUF952 family)
LTLIYKICPASMWQEAEAKGVFIGASIDLADGYIHFSTAEQAQETAAKHFVGQRDLLLVAIDPESLGASLRWEPSRGGALFPHLYGRLPTAAALWAKPLPLDASGAHDFSGLLLTMDASK